MTVVLCGCPDGEEGGSADAMPQDDPPRISYSGTYAADGTWDLSGPFSGEDGIGGTVADFIIREVVARSGVPSALEKEATDKVSSAIRPSVADFVNGKLPTTLAPGGELLTDLTRVLGSADVESTFMLIGSGDSVTGDETVTQLAFANGSDRLVLRPEDLIEAGASPEIRASIAGDRTASGFERDLAVYEIYFGTIVEKVVSELLGADLVLSTQSIVGAIDCAPIVSAITGGGSSLDVTVAGQTLSISAGDVSSACAAVTLAAADKVIGLFSRDTPVSLGGLISVSDLDADEVADRLTAGAGYGGTIAVVDPLIDPQLSVSFSAARQ